METTPVPPVPPPAQAVPSLQPGLHANGITAPQWGNRRILALVLPLLAEQFLIGSMGFINLFMAGFISEAAVSGVSLVETIAFLFTTIFTALATGGAVVTSQYLGRADKKNSCSSARHVVYINVAVSLIFMALTLVFYRHLLRLAFGDIAQDVMQAAQTYFFISAFSLPFLGLYSACAALFRSMGHSGITMRIAVLVNIINIGANLIFIHGFGFDIASPALASLIGRFTAAFILFFMLLRNSPRAINLKGITRFSFDWQMIKRILNVGVPTSLEMSMFQFGKILIARIFTYFGTAAIAANAAATAITSLGFFTCNAFSMAAVTIAGQCLGAGDYDGAKRNTKKLVAATFIVYFILNLIIIVFRNQFIGIFRLSQEAHEMAVTFILIHAFFSTLFWATSFVLPNALRAAGDARYVMIVSASTMWIVRVSAAFIMAFPLGMGPNAVWIAMGADFVFRTFFFCTRWARGRWMEKRVI